MKSSQLERVKNRLKKEYPHSAAASALRAAVGALVHFVQTRVRVDAELRDATHDRGAAALDQAIEAAAKAQVEAALLLDLAVKADLTEFAVETGFVLRALQWLDGDSLLLEADLLLHHADRLEMMAKAEAERAAARHIATEASSDDGDADITVEMPAESRRALTAQAAMAVG